MSGKHNIVIIEDDLIVQEVILNGISVGFYVVDVDPMTYDGQCPICRTPLLMHEDDEQYSSEDDECPECGWKKKMSYQETANLKIGWEEPF